MKIISHRGGAAFGLENSATAIKTSLEYNVDAIELDIRYTKDGHAVLIHDHTTERVAETSLNVHNSTLKELKAIKLKNGERLLTLEEALQIIDNRLPVYLDIKDFSTVRSFVQTLNKFPKTEVTLTGRIHHFVKAAAEEHGDTDFLVQSHFGPFEIIQTAKKLNATGITLNAWLLNPLTYRLVKRANLRLCIYTVNNPIVMWFIGKFYNDVWVNTNVPDRYVTKKRKKA